MTPLSGPVIAEDAPSVLVVDDEPGICFTLGALLRQEGLRVFTASTREEALVQIDRCACEVALVDIMLSPGSGLDLLREIRERSLDIRVIMITGNPDVESASEAVRLGAFDYITKPVRFDKLRDVVRLAIASRQAAVERERHHADLEAIFSSVSDAIVMADTEGRLLRFNAAAAAGCGYREDQIGSPLSTLGFGCGGTCRSMLEATLKTALPQQIKRFECHRHNGASVVTLTATPVRSADGTVTGAVAVIRDETRLDLLEKQLRQRDRFHGIVGASPPMVKLYALTEALADVPTTVLINGESGTGKELFAAALHHGGSRRNGPFVKVNCSALSDTLLESELFGHVRGAFTGAVTSKAGRFEKAHGGTILLDEIGDISPSMQMRLLRVLQELVIERVGDSTPIKVDVRVIAATNQDLAEKVRNGSFRQDLFYRLNVVRLVLPPLRERGDDVMLLAEHFLGQFSARFGRSIRAFSGDVVEFLRSHDWPGNVRELEHVIEHACILCRSDVITMADLPADLLEGRASSPRAVDPSADVVADSPLTLEQALALTDGNKSRAARLLGISRRTIYRHIK